MDITATTEIKITLLLNYQKQLLQRPKYLLGFK